MREFLRYILKCLFFCVCSILCADDPTPEKRIVVTPIIDLILNPWRYDDQAIKTYGFAAERDRSWYLVPFRDNLDYFDPSSSVRLDVSNISSESIDWLDRAHVLVFGKVRLIGKDREFPGEVYKDIIVTRIAIIGNPKLFWMELEMKEDEKDESPEVQKK